VHPFKSLNKIPRQLRDDTNPRYALVRKSTSPPQSLSDMGSMPPATPSVSSAEIRQCEDSARLRQQPPLQPEGTSEPPNKRSTASALPSHSLSPWRKHKNLFIPRRMLRLYFTLWVSLQGERFQKREVQESSPIIVSPKEGAPGQPVSNRNGRSVPARALFFPSSANEDYPFDPCLARRPEQCMIYTPRRRSCHCSRKCLWDINVHSHYAYGQPWNWENVRFYESIYSSEDHPLPQGITMQGEILGTTPLVTLWLPPQGMVPRVLFAFSTIFGRVRSRFHLSKKSSYIELYNAELRDLLRVQTLQPHGEQSNHEHGFPVAPEMLGGWLDSIIFYYCHLNEAYLSKI